MKSAILRNVIRSLLCRHEWQPQHRVSPVEIVSICPLCNSTRIEWHPEAA